MSLLGKILGGIVSDKLDSAAKEIGRTVEKTVKKAVTDSVLNAAEREMNDNLSALDRLKKAAENANSGSTSSSGSGESTSGSVNSESTSGSVNYGEAATLVKKHNEMIIIDDNAVESKIGNHGSVAYFEDVIESNISGVSVKTGVSAGSIGAVEPDWSCPIDIVVMKAGRPALAILLVPKNGYKKKAVINTMNACEKAGIPAIRFMQEFSNTEGYVVGRIKAVMK